MELLTWWWMRHIMDYLMVAGHTNIIYQFWQLCYKAYLEYLVLAALLNIQSIKRFSTDFTNSTIIIITIRWWNAFYFFINYQGNSIIFEISTLHIFLTLMIITMGINISQINCIKLLWHFKGFLCGVTEMRQIGTIFLHGCVFFVYFTYTSKMLCLNCRHLYNCWSELFRSYDYNMNTYVLLIHYKN